MIDEDKFLNYLSNLESILSADLDAKAQKKRVVLDQNDCASWDEAEKIYDEIRSDHEDVALISHHIAKTERVVTRVKDHVFYREHTFVVDDLIEIRKFDADPEIVNAWSRLKQGDFVPSDLELFKHEQVESILERRKGMDYFKAHAKTEELGFVWRPEEAEDGDSG